MNDASNVMAAKSAFVSVSIYVTIILDLVVIATSIKEQLDLFFWATQYISVEIFLSWGLKDRSMFLSSVRHQGRYSQIYFRAVQIYAWKVMMVVHTLYLGRYQGLCNLQTLLFVIANQLLFGDWLLCLCIDDKEYCVLFSRVSINFGRMVCS